MRVWYLGDSALAGVVQGLSDDIVDLSTPGASGDHTRIEQCYDRRLLAHEAESLAVIFVNEPDYDSEVIISLLLDRLIGASPIVLMVYPENAGAAHGMLHHYEGDRFKLVPLDSLDPSVAATRLQAVL